VAWDGGRPLGHAHIAWSRTRLGLPELQDVFVAEHARRFGVATELFLAAERETAARGHRRYMAGTIPGHCLPTRSASGAGVLAGVQ